MGNACCVAARDKMVVPNRGRVPAKDTSLSWLPSHGISPNDTSDLESGSSLLSSQGSPLDNYLTQKSPASDQSFSRNPSIDTVSEQIIQNPVSSPSPAKRSVSFASSPLSSQSHSQMPPTLKVTPRTRLSKQVSDGQILGFNSPSRSSSTEERLGNELHYEPSDAWSMQAFSEMMVYSRRESYFYDKIDHQGNRKSQTTCCACSRSLSQKSLLGSQKIFATDELSVAAILVCGHVYHSECLEKMTPEKDMFDPPCPVCTFGEKRMLKLSEKALRDDLDSRAKLNKRLRKGAVDSNDFVMLDHRHKGKVSKLVKSSSLRSYSPKPFLARHFSFGSRSNSINSTKSPKENHSATSLKKKGFFWTKSSKV